MRSPMGPLLQQLRTPTLVLHSRDFALLAAEEAMKTARLAKARFATVEGRSAYDHPGQVIAAIESFLAELPSPAEPVATGELSQREIEVLKLLAQGRSNPDIAKELFITRNTVQNHVSSILIKLNLQNRAQAAVYAKEHGVA
jgi:NarL family two-component system response regulator LiaR